MSELVSVVMSVYNEREDWLRLAIESILNQTYKNIEFIIVNDQPGNSQMEAIILEYVNKDSRIVYIKNEKNSGPALARNNGFMIAKGNYIAIMDSDDISFANRIEVELKYLKDNNCDIVSAYMNDIAEDGTKIRDAIVRCQSPQLISKLLRYDFCVPNPIMLLKKTVIQALNGYRDLVTPEDYDFVVRAINRGYVVGLCDDVLADYRIKEASISRSRAVEQLLLAKFIMKHFDNIENADIVAYANSIRGTIKPKTEAKYLKARGYIRLAAANGGAKACVYIIKAVLTSTYAWNNIYRIVMLRIVRMLNKQRV